MVMASPRIRSYWTKWNILATYYGDMCFYCGEEAATTIDHVLPFSYINNDDIDNLRPACALCNCLAGSKVFSSLDEKRWYILARRRNRKQTRHHSCSECGAPFIYREQSPSLFLCPECYDLEYSTHTADCLSWRNWIELLNKANMEIEIYRQAGRLYRANGNRGRKWLNTCLVESMRLTEARYLTPQCLVD